MSFEIRTGERIALLGANGSGKSTLLKILDGLVFPTSGELTAYGQPLTDDSLSDPEINARFRSRVGFVFQNSDSQVFSATVREEIAFGCLQLGLSAQQTAARTADVLAMLEIEGLTRRFGDRTAVDQVTLRIPDGQIVGVIGRSGAGKSTLLRMVNRLADPSEGRILFEGVDVTALRGLELRQWRARSAMIFQQFNLVGRLDVLTNVLMGRLAAIPAWRSVVQLWPEADKALAMSALEQFDMAGLAAQRADQLSGGQQQRVAIARALVQEPDIVLADEPIASLDPRNTRIVMDALLRINKHFGITVLCNLHSLDLARSYCDRLIGMAAGRVVFDGAPEALTDHIARELYDLEANEVMGGQPAVQPDAATIPAAVAA